MNRFEDVERWLAAGHQCALAVYDRLPVYRAVMVEPAPGGDREDELYTRLEERLRSGKRERAALRAYGVVAVHRPERITHLFDAFVSRIAGYFDGYPPSYDIASTDQVLSPRVPPLYAALSIVLRTDADVGLVPVVDAVIGAGELEDSAEFGFARELWFVMENHPSTIPDVAAYGDHSEAAVRYLVMLSVAETLEWNGHTFDESTLAERFEPLVQAALDGLTDPDDRVRYRAALALTFASRGHADTVSDNISAIKEHRDTASQEQVAEYLDTVVDNVER